jgi:hypothetical protein
MAERNSLQARQLAAETYARLHKERTGETMNPQDVVKVRKGVVAVIRWEINCSNNLVCQASVR